MPKFCERFKVVNLVSDLVGVAPVVDPNLLNPWGLVIDNNTLWVADNGAGVITHYDLCSNKLPPAMIQLFLADGTTLAAPTGLVRNNTSGFLVNGSPAFLITATEDGDIFAIDNSFNAFLVVDNSATGAVYKGLTIANNQLYVTNFNAGTVEVYDNAFNQLSGFSFSDSSLPAGFAPFNIATICNKLYVTYALQDAAKHDDVAGPGNGFVNIFNFDGTFVKRFASQGPLNSPWAILKGPKNLCLENDIIIGNFGDGAINVFSKCGCFLGAFRDRCKNPLLIPKLWSLVFNCDRFFFTQGLNNEQDGVLGYIKEI